MTFDKPPRPPIYWHATEKAYQQCFSSFSLEVTQPQYPGCSLRCNNVRRYEGGDERSAIGPVRNVTKCDPRMPNRMRSRIGAPIFWHARIWTTPICPQPPFVNSGGDGLPFSIAEIQSCIGRPQVKALAL